MLPANTTSADEVISEDETDKSAELLGLEMEQESIRTRSFTQPIAKESTAVRKGKGARSLGYDGVEDEHSSQRLRT